MPDKEYVKNYRQKVRKLEKRRRREKQIRIEKNTTTECMRRKALRNVFQFHSYPCENSQLRKAVDSVIEDTTFDLDKHFTFINHQTYLQCCSCGIRKLPDKFKE